MKRGGGADFHSASRARLAIAFLFACRCSHLPAPAVPTAQERARGLLRQGQADKAIPILAQLHRQAPDDLGIARTLVEAHLKAGRAGELIAQLSSRESAGAAKHYMLGLAYFGQSPHSSPPAIRELQAAIALAPREAELPYRLGLALLASEQFRSALPPLERAAELAPARSDILLTLARARYRLGDFEGAVSALRKLVAASPTRAEVVAAREVMDAIADPFTAVPPAARGALESSLRLLHEMDAPQQAIAALDEIARQNPRLSIVHTLLALAYQRLDDDGSAVDELKRAIELSPSDGRALYYLGEVYVRRRRTAQAQECFQRAVELNPLLQDAYLRLGDWAIEERDLLTAQAQFQIGVALSPDSLAPRAKLALAMQLQGNWAGAERELREVLKRDPDNLELKLRMGQLFLDKRNRSLTTRERESAGNEAARWWREVLKVDSQNPIAIRGLQTISAR